MPKEIDGTIAVRSIESNIDDRRLDASLRYMVEDNLITNLIQNGYRVVERDPDVLDNLYRESSNKFQTKISNNNNNSKDDVVKRGRDINHDVDGSVININISDSEKNDEDGQLIDDTDENGYEITNLSSSDYILSYRVLECGISYRDAKDEDNSGFNFSDISSEEIERTARTKLHCRLTNSKTSEIMAAGLLESKVQDTIKAEDLFGLEQIPHDFYVSTLPLIHTGNLTETDGHASINDTIHIEKAGKKGKIKRNTWIYILGGIALMSLDMFD